jgi:hypothetical protein
MVVLRIPRYELVENRSQSLLAAFIRKIVILPWGYTYEISRSANIGKAKAFVFGNDWAVLFCPPKGYYFLSAVLVAGVVIALDLKQEIPILITNPIQNILQILHPSHGEYLHSERAEVDKQKVDNRYPRMNHPNRRILHLVGQHKGKQH